MDEHPNARMYRETLEAAAGGDPEALARSMADDVVWHEIGRDEPRRGKQAVLDSFGEWLGDVEAELHDVVANDEHVLALMDAVARKDGKELRYRTVEIMHVRDGKVTERWAFADDTGAVAGFFA